MLIQISDKTIEENILLRSNQKRRLGEMALDEAEFTPEFFKDASNIRELFSNEEGVADIVRAPTTVPQSYREIEKVCIDYILKCISSVSCLKT